jgi:glyoxylase-like metal-dependent hydrolase (beta-lactamase superfamily II)
VRVHHLNCGTMMPAVVGRIVCHVLLCELEDRLVLVDTGFGLADVRDPRRLGPARRLLAARLDEAETALRQVEALGFAAGDVRDIVLTHLDLDHAGGLGDFPSARVHVFADELAAARARASVKEKSRYIEAQWAHGPTWVEHPVAGEDWLGFDSVRVIGDDVLLVPLRGHTRGHSGVAVRRPSGGWFLHAGDSYFNHGEKENPPTCPSGLRLFQTMVQMDKKARHANADRVRSLHAEHGPASGSAEPVTVFCAHDAVEFDALADVTD